MAQAESARGYERAVRTSDLFVWLWRLLASAQFALALIAVLAVAGLLAVVLPQVPSDIRGNPIAVSLWLESRRDDFGPFTDALERLGLFNVVETWWFLTALALLVLSICVYTVDRLLVTWRTIARPRERLPDSFFDRAANRLVLSPEQAGDASLEVLLRRRRFVVRSFADGPTTYLFADRFAWAQMGNFLSHAALVVFLIGGLVSRTEGFSSALFIAEGETSPVFAVSHPDQMQVEVVDAIARFDASGQPRDYRSQLVIYQGGREVERGVATVNDPLEYKGYRFHQVGYSGDGAAIRVNDAATGRATYSEVLALDQRIAAPAVTVRDRDGQVLIDDVIVPTDFVGDASGTLISVPGNGREFWVGLSQDASKAWELVVYERDNESARFLLSEGASRSVGGLSWTFKGPQALPAVIAEDFPGDSQRAMVLLSESGGRPFLTLLGPVQDRALTLYPGQAVRIGEREYVFEGRREFSGIRVRKDPGANFIWVAAALLIAGLLMTFYVPRLRLWARVRQDETVIAAQAERSGVFQAEAKRITRELGKRRDTH